MIRYCPDCAESYDPRYSSHDCGDDDLTDLDEKVGRTSNLLEDADTGGDGRD